MRSRGRDVARLAIQNRVSVAILQTAPGLAAEVTSISFKVETTTKVRIFYTVSANQMFPDTTIALSRDVLLEGASLILPVFNNEVAKSKQYMQVSHELIVPVDAGSHTVSLQVWEDPSGGVWNPTVELAVVEI